MEKDMEFVPSSSEQPAENSLEHHDESVADPLLPAAIDYLFWLKDVKYPTDHGGKKLSIPTVSKLTGLSIHTINNFLYGKTKDPHLFSFGRIIQCFGGSIDELLGIGAYSQPWRKPDVYLPAASDVEENPAAPVENAVQKSPSAPAEVIEAAVQSATKHKDEVIAHLNNTISLLKEDIRHLQRMNRILLFSFLVETFALIGLFAYDITHFDKGWIQYEAARVLGSISKS